MSTPIRYREIRGGNSLPGFTRKLRAAATAYEDEQWAGSESPVGLRVFRRVFEPRDTPT